MRVTRASHRLPPASNGIDCEARRVVVDPDAHPPGIVGDVVDAVGRRPTELRDDEVVHADRFGPTLRAVLTPTIAEIAHQLVSRPAGLRRQSLAERCVRLSPHTAPIRQTRRSF